MDGRRSTCPTTARWRELNLAHVPWRRNRRRMFECKRDAIEQFVLKRNCKRQHANKPRDRDHVDPRRWRLSVAFLLRGFSLVYDVTKRTRMIAVERTFHCFAKRCLLGVLNHHRSPGNRLESDPLQTDRETECNDCSEATHQADHARRLASKSALRQIRVWLTT
jgi:hypothetical protein